MTRLVFRPLAVCLALPLLALVACGPVSERRAYEQCSERARLATGPGGSVGVGVGNSGLSGNFDVTITSDFIRGRDPYIVYDNCFRQLTGAGPTRPLRL